MNMKKYFISNSVFLAMMLIVLLIIFKPWLTPVSVGETWVRNPPKDPFDAPSAVDTRTVIAVSNGYVQYTWRDGRYTGSSSRAVFVYDSKKMKEEVEN